MKLAVVGDAASVNVQRWCEGLADAGASVEVVSFASGWRDDIIVRRLPFGDRLGKARYLLLGPLVRRTISRMEPDVVIGYFVTGYGTLARLARRQPLVQVTAGDDVLLTTPGTVAHRMARRNLSAADLVIAWAPHMAEAVRSFGVPERRIYIRPRGIPLGGYPREIGSVSPGPRVIVTRSLRPEYRHEAILEAISLVADPALTLTVVGYGPLLPRLQAVAAGLHVEHRVRFVGRVPNAALPEMLLGHDIYVSAARSDGLSASLLEAMAAGLIPVVVDHPANAALIQHGVTGLLTSGDAEQLAEALRRAATDADLRTAAAKLNPELVRRDGDLDRNATLFFERLQQLTA